MALLQLQRNESKSVLHGRALFHLYISPLFSTKRDNWFDNRGQHSTKYSAGFPPNAPSSSHAGHSSHRGSSLPKKAGGYAGGRGHFPRKSRLPLGSPFPQDKPIGMVCNRNTLGVVMSDRRENRQSLSGRQGTLYPPSTRTASMVSGWSLARIFRFFGSYWKLRRSTPHAERVIFLRPVASERAAPGRGFRVEAGCLGANRIRRRAMTAQSRMPACPWSRRTRT